jgi:hypothetical protein
MANRLPFDMKPPEARSGPSRVTRVIGRILAIAFWAVLIFVAILVAGRGLVDLLR